uniref:Uncharacterized protein n=1 Tax=Myotis lucifugus TaxID=59463 RepID=G1Q170_MYOLU
DLEAKALGCWHLCCATYHCSTRYECAGTVTLCRESCASGTSGTPWPQSHPPAALGAYSIYFADGKFALYKQPPQHKCPRCPALPPSGLFDLEQTMRQQHEFFAKLCLKPLRIFRNERAWSSHQALVQHRLLGPGDTQHRAPQPCMVCRERCLHKDERLSTNKNVFYLCASATSDGGAAQGCYSDSPYLHKHFPETHVLRGGRCSTSGRAPCLLHLWAPTSSHRTACIAPRTIRSTGKLATCGTGEGLLSGQDLEEVNKCNLTHQAGQVSGQGARQSRGSWRQRREGDREGAAIRASMALQQQQETCRSEDRRGNALKKEEAGVWGPQGPRGGLRPVRGSGGRPGPKEAWANGPESQEAFPAPSPAEDHTSEHPPAPTLKLKGTGFPVSTLPLPLLLQGAALGPVGLVLLSPVLARGPAPAGKATHLPDILHLQAQHSPPPSPPLCPEEQWQLQGGAAHPSGPGCWGSQPPGRLRWGEGQLEGRVTPHGGRGSEEEVEEEEKEGPTWHGRCLLPVALASTQTFTKVSKNTKVGSEKLGAASPRQCPLRMMPPGAEQPPPPPGLHGLSPGASSCHGQWTSRGLGLKSFPKEPPELPWPQGPPIPHVPALRGPLPFRIPPPPGFSTAVLLRGTLSPLLDVVPSVSKSSLSFPRLPSPLPACVPSTTTRKAPRLTPVPRTYLGPERGKNLRLTRSIKGFLQTGLQGVHDSLGEFRWGVISTAQYYKSCSNLLWKKFQKIVNVAVLQPNRAQRQELLSAHPGAEAKLGCPTEAKENKKSSWQTSPGQASTQQTGMDCCVRPTYQQVPPNGEVSSHQALHTVQDGDFPSLPAVARALT